MFVVICFGSNRKLQYTCLFVKGLFWVLPGWFRGVWNFSRTQDCVYSWSLVPGLSMDCNLYLIHLFAHPLAPCWAYHISSIQSQRNLTIGPVVSAHEATFRSGNSISKLTAVWSHCLHQNWSLPSNGSALICDVYWNMRNMLCFFETQKRLHRKNFLTFKRKSLPFPNSQYLPTLVLVRSSNSHPFCWKNFSWEWRLIFSQISNFILWPLSLICWAQRGQSWAGNG